MKPSARTLALKVIQQVDQEGAYSNIALNNILEKFQPDKKDRGFITELVYGTLRRLNTLDWVAGKFISRPLGSLSPWIRNIIRMGIYQLFFMDRVPVSAACNESTNLAKKFGHRGTVGFVNGVLRNIARKKDEIEWPDKDRNPALYLAVTYSHPDWLVKLWLSEFGFEQTEKLCQANNEVPPNSIRTNTLKVSRSELVHLLQTEGVSCREGSFAPETIHIEGFHSIGRLKGHAEGLFMVQDESSTMVGHVLAPQQGTKVIDACSAPGGKSTHLAQLMKNNGEIVSADIHQHKMGLIRENCTRLGIDIVETVVNDAVKLDKKYKDWADYVLVDAPCSGLGVLRRRPEMRWRKTVEQFKELVSLQKSIIRSASLCVRKEGILVYSTCTINKEENIEVIKSFLMENDNFIIDDITGYFPEKLNEELFPTAKKGYIQFLPHIHGTDGFFMARLKRIK